MFEVDHKWFGYFGHINRYWIGLFEVSTKAILFSIIGMNEKVTIQILAACSSAGFFGCSNCFEDVAENSQIF